MRSKIRTANVIARLKISCAHATALPGSPANSTTFAANHPRNGRNTGTRRILAQASDAAGIGHLTTHAFRHTYRSWLDAVKAPIAVQQKMMRHASIITTMDVYGDVITDEARTASLKVAALAFQGNGAQAERESS